MIANILCDLFYAFWRSKKEPFRTFKPYLLDIGGVGQAGLALDQTVKVILLEMKDIYQILDDHVFIILLDIFGDFFEDNPVHGLPLLSGKGELIFGTHNPEDAKQQALVDIAGASGAVSQFVKQQAQAVFHLLRSASPGLEVKILLQVFLL